MSENDNKIYLVIWVLTLSTFIFFNQFKDQCPCYCDTFDKEKVEVETGRPQEDTHQSGSDD